MKFGYILSIVFLFSCSIGKNYNAYVGDKKEHLIMKEGQPSELSYDAGGNEVLTYWVRSNYRNKKYDVAMLHSFFIDSKGNIYNYQSSIRRTMFLLPY